MTKTKVITQVDIEKLNSIQEFVDYAATVNRFTQAFDEVFSKTKTQASMRNVSDLLKWVINDIIKEEADTLCANKLMVKDVNSTVSKKAVAWFKKEISK